MPNATDNPLSLQEGGSHYKGMVIQPVEFIHANNIGFCEATAIKYLCRWRKKGGLQDLRKAIHFIQVLIELETRQEPEPEPTMDQVLEMPVRTGPYCNNCDTNLADFRKDNGKYFAPRYWCSDCACDKKVDTSEMTLMGQVA